MTGKGLHTSSSLSIDYLGRIWSRRHRGCSHLERRRVPTVDRGSNRVHIHLHPGCCCCCYSSRPCSLAQFLEQRQCSSPSLVQSESAPVEGSGQEEKPVGAKWRVSKIIDEAKMQRNDAEARQQDKGKVMASLGGNKRSVAGAGVDAARAMQSCHDIE